MTSNKSSSASLQSLPTSDKGRLRRTALYGLGCLALPAALIVYCESYTVVLGLPAPGLGVSGPWALQVSLGWFLAVAMLGIFGTRLAQSTIASQRPRTVFIAAIVGVAVFELACECTLQYFDTGNEHMLAFALERVLPMLAGSTLLMALSVGNRVLATIRVSESRERTIDAGGPDLAHHPETIEVMTGTGRTLIRVEEIECLMADGNYISVVHTTGRTYLLRQTMAAAERLLDPERFVRVHRSTIVNRRYTKELRSSGVLVLQSGRTVVIGRAYRERVPMRSN